MQALRSQSSVKAGGQAAKQRKLASPLPRVTLVYRTAHDGTTEVAAERKIGRTESLWTPPKNQLNREGAALASAPRFRFASPAWTRPRHSPNPDTRSCSIP